MQHQAIALRKFLYNVKIERGQRKACGSILSKDIGVYNSCIPYVMVMILW